MSYGTHSRSAPSIQLFGPDDPLPKPTAADGLLYCARWYADLGLRVHPLEVGGKDPNRKLLGKGWTVESIGSTDPDQIEQWWLEEPFANIGIAQGPSAGTVVLDKDTKRGQDPAAELAAWSTEHSVAFLPGPCAVTPSGGWHDWYLLPPRVEVLRRVHGWRPGVDVQAGGSYVVAPPSHIQQRSRRVRLNPGDPKPTKAQLKWQREWDRLNRPWLGYQWIDPDGAEWWPTQREFLAALGRSVLPTEFLVDVMDAATRRISEGTDADYTDLRDGRAPVPVEQWRENGLPPDAEHQPSYWLAACSMAGRGIDREEAKDILREIVAKTPLADPDWPWEDEELVDLIERAYDGLPELRANEAASLAARMDSVYGRFLKGLER